MPFPVPLFRRGQAKPFGSIPRINLDHPLARGLKFYGYDIGGVVLDLVGGAASTPDASPPPYTVSSSAFGSGVLYPNGVLTGGLSIPSSPAVKAVTAPFTWACGCIQTVASPANSFNRIWGRTANNGSPAPFENWCFQTNVSGVGTSVRSGWSVNSSTEGDSATWSIVANQFTSLLAMFTTPTNVDSYSQGIKQNSTTTSYSSTNTNDNIFFGDPGPATGLGQSFPGFVFYGAFWNRALTAAEALLLHQDPYCFLIYPEDEMLATLVGVSGGGTISLALATTETPDTAAFALSLPGNFTLSTTEAPDVAAFTATFADQLVLAATETPDAAAFTTSVSDQLSFATTETPDVAAFTTAFADQFALAVTEAADTAAFAAAFSDQFALATTEAPDVAAFTTAFSDQFTLAATESADVASFNLGGVISLTLAVTESPDVAALSASISDQLTLAVTEAPDAAAFVVNDPTTLALAVTETPDVAAFTAAFADQFGLTVTESPDMAAFTATVSDQLVLATTEAPDVAAFTVGLVGTPVFSLVTTENSDVANFTLSVFSPIPPKTRSPIPRSLSDYGWYDRRPPMRKLGRR